MRIPSLVAFDGSMIRLYRRHEVLGLDISLTSRSWQLEISSPKYVSFQARCDITR